MDHTTIFILLAVVVAAALTFDFFNGFLGELRLEIHHGDIRPFGGELEGDGLADAAPGPRHHRHLIQ